MKIVFADTSFYIALLQKTDRLHAQAAELSDTHRGRVVTTAWVLMELGNYFSPVLNRTSFVRLAGTLRQSPYVSIIRPDHRYFQAGLELYSKRLDKAWSLVDCISFLVMGQHNITDAWTADHHFMQAGFNALLSVSDA